MKRYAGLCLPVVLNRSTTRSYNQHQVLWRISGRVHLNASSWLSQIQIDKNAETKKLKADRLQAIQQNLVDEVRNVPPSPVSNFWQSIALRIKLGLLQIASGQNTRRACEGRG
ncbi:hypothetical protein ARMSODRAFT_602436 [Armillaria solidipes]|uniref:Uncharacterized protein n=1 Tax=Armillaria solidipes TaxID=1076256 RepID=A0A2H3AYA8_9AGAR|nr:hypothetical protein ARMSODRAFT_602436 [Armillaria solidipes]